MGRWVCGILNEGDNDLASRRINRDRFVKEPDCTDCQLQDNQHGGFLFFFLSSRFAEFPRFLSLSSLAYHTRLLYTHPGVFLDLSCPSRRSLFAPTRLDWTNSIWNVQIVTFVNFFFHSPHFDTSPHSKAAVIKLLVSFFFSFSFYEQARSFALVSSLHFFFISRFFQISLHSTNLCTYTT